MKKPLSVILPGSYDPVTLGHLDVIKRASEEYEEVYAVIFKNPNKQYHFSLDERVKMLMLATDSLDNVLVSCSDGFVVDYMREHGIEKIIKGVRGPKDVEYEKAQAEYNFAHGGYETELVPCREEFRSLSSTLAREKIKNGESLVGILPQNVIEFLKSR